MIARPASRPAVSSPEAYQAEGTLVVAGKVASLEDRTGLRWPLGVLLQELAGRAVRLRVEPLEPKGAEP